MFHGKIVIESIFDIGTESELDVGIEPHDGTCHEMRGGVAEGVEVDVVLHG